mmetsp:Transcript_11617/g.28629  ORF Transcript_11617/g.28629 Transcript_11617/m.28629 type:complete len:575 (-) Transcript_11617:141-1865(-)
MPGPSRSPPPAPSLSLKQLQEIIAISGLLLGFTGVVGLTRVALTFLRKGSEDGDDDGGVVEYKIAAGDLKDNLLGDEKLLQAVREEAIPYALCHGLVMRSATGSQSFVHAPFTLLPSKLPKLAFEQATDAAALFSKLVDKIARDKSYLEDVLTGVAQNDDYTQRLIDILKATRRQGERKQNVTLGIFRSDYMLQKSEGEGSSFPQPRFLQVENNTIAASFGCLSTRVAGMHAHLVDHFMADPKIASAFYPKKTAAGGGDQKNYGEAVLPENSAIANLAEAMAEAIRAYKESEGIVQSRNVYVMMVVQPGEANAADQRLLEYALLKNHNVKMVRATFMDVATECKGRDTDGQPLVFNDKHIGLVYFRAGYTPRDLPSETEWNAYKIIEMSRAVKCPCISYHLAGTKKIQQKLNEKGELERFLTIEESKTLRLFFADQYGLSLPLDDDAKKAVADAIANPHLYVLKPQREGGGNNLWLDEMKQALMLKTMNEEERSAYILMRRIVQEPFPSALMRNGKVVVGECEKEVGIYASYIGGRDRSYGKVVGHLMRTKLVGVNEGGVASGYAVLDSPVLIS